MWDVIGDYAKTPEWLPKIKGGHADARPFREGHQGDGTRVEHTLDLNFKGS